MRRGFTLIEMLVATALVVLIMVLFAEIFQEAIRTVRTQRGLIANDEKARVFTQTLRSDLDRATFRASVARGASFTNTLGIVESPRGIVSLAPGDRPDPRQQGFIYIAENDPLDDGDDILHLTASLGDSLRDPLVSNPSYVPYQGRGTSIGGANDLNQPDLDDGVNDGAATSRAAEVCYFLRGTTLFRRVLLLRDPLTHASPPYDTQPSSGLNGTGGPLMSTWPNAANVNGLMYRDFDFASTNINGRLHFHGLESLDNTRGLSNSPLAAPFFRFGHRADTGQPREYDSNNVYFGRLTQEETSHQRTNGLGTTGFRWPGADDGVNNRIVDSALITSPAGLIAVDGNTNGTFEGNEDQNGNGILDRNENDGAASPPNDNSDGILDVGPDVALHGSRTGEEIFMTNVEAFDIEVWDPGYSEADYDGAGGWVAYDPDDDLNLNGVQDAGIWVDLGNGTQTGLFPQTWQAATNKPGNTTWGRQNNAYGGNGPSGNHVFDTWHPGLGAAPPIHPLQIEPTNTRVVNWTANTAWTNQVVFPDASASSNATIGYVVVSAGTTGSRQPEWPREPGALVRDGGVTWQCFDNRVGLEKIRITIRFRDTGTGQARQVSLIHAFTE